MAKQKFKRRKARSSSRRRSSDRSEPVSNSSRRPVLMRPRVWQGEPTEDQAVFDDQALEGLDPQLAAEVVAVRESLQMVAGAADQSALDRLSGIPRRSPMSDWRMLVGGLIEWYAARIDAAAQVWHRLDSQRRPGRIAAALLAAQRDDLSNDPSISNENHLADGDLLAAARRVRKTWIDRPALSDASRYIDFKENKPESPDGPPVFLSSQQLTGLLEFSRRYRDLEPDLTSALQQAALQRAFMQPFTEIFDRAQKTLPGPLHDPANLLFRFHYYRLFEDYDEQSRLALKQYLNTSLPGNNQISPALRGALRSQIQLLQARDRLIDQRFASPLALFSRGKVKSPEVEPLFLDSIKSFPANAAAHEAYIAWLRELLDNDDLDKSTHQELESKLKSAMVKWNQCLPEEIEPRLWLVDEFLSDEALELAKPHVEWLSHCRHPDPRVRVIPWKWQMLEAMRLCRRKNWLTQASDSLDAAETLWPTWLSKNWLSYLRAALALRGGQHDSFQQQRAQILSDQVADDTVSDLADAVMMLAAAQRMRVPAADLKPLRQPVDEAVAKLPQLAIQDLTSLGSFFWDLHRVNMLYPAYRMHGKKFALQLRNRLKNSKRIDGSSIDPHFWNAIYWISERRLWDPHALRPLPACLTGFANDPRYQAAIAHYLLTVGKGYRVHSIAPTLSGLRAAASNEQDAYNRFWFDSLAQRIDEAVAAYDRELKASYSNPFFGFPLDAFAGDDDDFSPDCLCDYCTERRERAGIPHPTPVGPSKADGAGNDDATSADWYAFDPPSPPRPKPTEIPLDPEFRRKRPKNPLAKKRKKKKK